MQEAGGLTPERLTMFAAHFLLAISATLLAGFSQSPGTAARGAPDLSRLVVGASDTIQTLDAKSLRGTPTRLAWSPDGQQLYLRVSTFDRWANEKVSHAIVSMATRELATIAAEPAWAARYWLWKAAPAAPAREDFAIKLETREELVRTTNVPREGNIGQHVADPFAGLDEVARNAALASQKTRFQTLTVRGQVIDRAINQQVLPGRRFGWAPAPHALLAFVNTKERLALMDEGGRTREIKKTKNVLLPAWSENGARIAFLQKSGRNTFTLRVFDVRHP